ncbi:MAG: excinuclease ABC subunit UvrA [Candidatus Eisenbacteria bacterium]|nr:excinuclease ABC subunit UvrA [Candidatus Eisenbacteria bacterium]MCC7141822.1 excinuclease ABC subunit UvrA [Candidatus Eisenbacteria bacterium]
MDRIVIEGAREHNLKNLSLTLPRNALVVLTGVSGSGKSSLAFDTLYAEGQRRYVESLSAYARQFLGQMEKPDVDRIDGLSPAISIEQRSGGHNPRSTVATTTEIYDYLRVLFARVGVQYCPTCDRRISRQSVDEIVVQILERHAGARVQVLAPVVEGRKGEYRKELDDLRRQGFLRVRIDGAVHSLDDDLPPLEKQKRHTLEVVVDRIEVQPARRQRLVDSIETALKVGKGVVRISRDGVEDQLFSEETACLNCGRSFDPLHPRNFSFNSPYGACPDCQGLGALREIDEDLVVTDDTLSINDGALAVYKGAEASWHASVLGGLAKYLDFSLDTPWKKLPAKIRKVILHGTGGKDFEVHHKGQKGEVRWRSKYSGVIPNLMRRYRESDSEEVRASIEKFMSSHPCGACSGARLKPESLSVRIGDWNIDRWTRLSVRQSLAVAEAGLPGERERAVGDPILKEIRERLRFLENVGLGYLTLDRASATLSGGEAQRIRLATQIGSQLTGVLYILDEPSIGLHHRDNQKLLATLLRLRDLGNTVVVVEHDRDTMLEADWLVDLGPGAGRHGGEIVAAGTPKEVLKHPTSLTGLYLSHRRTIPYATERRPGSGQSIRVIGAAEHNLRGVDVEFPLGRFICVTGVSGSGKSTLVHQILSRAMQRALYKSGPTPGKHTQVLGLEHIDKFVEIDQSPIGRTPRSNPATYTGAFTDIRDLFAKLPEAKVRGYQPGRFSFNVKGGRCESCRGDGVVKIEMHFLPDVYVRCEICAGRRYNRETLEVAWKGKTIADVLDLTVEEGCELLANIPSLKRKLGTLRDVGLGYLQLGQSATTLSGGEAQRVKLATELSRVSTGRTLYILDEPTTGLHFEDIRVLLQVLSRLVDAGNTVLVIEHNLDVVRAADHLIDLGPEGGEGGGQLVAVGTPEEVAGHPTSYTGEALRSEGVVPVRSGKKAAPAGTRGRRGVR